MRQFLVLFIYTLGWLLIIPSLFPNLHLLFFAPLLVFIFYQKEKINCLWLALFCGLTIDLFAVHTRFGIYALNYCLTSLLVYPLRNYFFKDSMSTLPLMTLFFSIVSTLIQLVILYALGQGFILSWQWIKEDLIGMPLYDALYAFLLFTLPMTFIPKALRRALFFSSSKHSY